jgi:hypothetical protein
MIAFLALAALSLTCAEAHAGAKYRTQYTSMGGGTINAVVDINGANGTYTLDDGSQGTLFNLKLQNLGGQQILRGNCSLNGVSGTVTWRMDGTLDQMDGTWQSGGQTGSWTGMYSDGSGPIGNQGPVKLPT